MVAVWLLALWRALAVGGCHAFHPVAIALLVGGGLPLVSAHTHSSHRSSTLTPPRWAAATAAAHTARQQPEPRPHASM